MGAGGFPDRLHVHSMLCFQQFRLWFRLRIPGLKELPQICNSWPDFKAPAVQMKQTVAKDYNV
jgi:hypothetical protein